MMLDAENLSRMLLLIEQIEGEPSHFNDRYRLLLEGMSHLDTVLNEKISKQLLKESASLCPEALAISIGEVHAIHHFVKMCLSHSLSITHQDVSTFISNFNVLKDHAESPGFDKLPVYTFCKDALKRINSFNESVKILFSNKVSKTTVAGLIPNQLTAACDFDGWFTGRKTFAPFGFNGSMCGNLSSGLIKVYRVSMSTHERFIKIFISDVQNLGLHQDIKYFVDRFSEFEQNGFTVSPELQELFHSLLRIKGMTNEGELAQIIRSIKQNGVNVIRSFKSTYHMSEAGSSVAALSEDGAKDAAKDGVNADMGRGMGGGKIVKSSRKHKHKYMKGGAHPNKYQLEELHRIYHNLSFKICILLGTYGIDMDSLDIYDVVTQFITKLKRNDIVLNQRLYDDFMVIVSEYANQLLDLELSPLYNDHSVVYDYEHDVETLQLIHSLFIYFITISSN